MKIFQKVFSIFEDMASGLFLSAGLVLMFYEVIMRYVLNNPTTWINEISTILVVWGILLGLSPTLRDNHHIQVELVYEILPSTGKKVVNVIANSMGVIFCLFFTIYGTQLVLHMFESQQVTMETRTPMWVVYSVIPIAGVMFLARFVERLVKSFRPSSLEDERKDKEDIGGYSALV